MKNFQFKIFISLYTLLILVTNLPAQVFNTSLSSKLQSQLDEALISHNFMGMSATIISDDYGIWKGVSGLSQPAINDSINPQMIFGIGSVTKTYIATLIMQLEDEEFLSIGDSLYQWLPTYPNIDSTITIKQLLKHESGLFDITDSPVFFEVLNQDSLHIWQPEEILLRLVDEPLFKPGESYSYSNTNYILLGMILQKVTGKSISTLLKNRILNPLNLSSTFLAIEDSLNAEVAHGWLDVDGDSSLDDFTDYWPINAFYSALWTAGAIYASAEDAAIFMKALFDGKLVSSESLEKMKDFNNPAQYGLGIYGFTLQNNITLMGHWGITLEYSAFVYYEAGTKTTIAVLVNQRDVEQFSMQLIVDFINTLKNFTPTAITERAAFSDNFALDQNWPNPFNPSTSISYTLPQSANTQLTVYNAIGQKVRTLMNGLQESGKHSLSWNGKNDSGVNVASGFYIYRLQAGNFKQTRRMLLTR